MSHPLTDGNDLSYSFPSNMRKQLDLKIFDKQLEILCTRNAYQTITNYSV